VKLYDIYRAPNELTSPKIAKAFHHRYGFNIKDNNTYCGNGWLGFGSPHNWQSLQDCFAMGDDFVYIDHAYFGRHDFYRVTKNAYFHSGVGDPDYGKLRMFYPRDIPWRKSGGRIVVCPQSDGFFIRRDIDPKKWLDDTCARIRTLTDRPITIRTKKDRIPFRVHLRDAWAVVSYSSNAGFEAIMQGVPAIYTADSHARLLATDFACIENPYYPDNRNQVAAVLAANQWRLDEIRDGECDGVL